MFVCTFFWPPSVVIVVNKDYRLRIALVALEGKIAGDQFEVTGVVICFVYRMFRIFIAAGQNRSFVIERDKYAFSPLQPPSVAYDYQTYLHL